MILGGGVYQIPLIRKVKELGYKSIVVSPFGNYPGIKIADIYLNLDTTNIADVLSEAKKFEIDSIITTGTDVCVPTIGRVVDELNLYGTGFEASMKSMDKVRMKDAFKSNGVPTANYHVFTDFFSAVNFVNKIALPIMVKATDSSGSRGITKVENIDFFKEAWERAYEVSKSKQIVIEEFLEGIEFGAQVIIHGDKVVKIFIHSDTVSESPYYTPIGHSIPSEDLNVDFLEIEYVLNKTIKAIGLKNCIANVDLMLVNGKPFIIEIGARMGATCLPEIISIYSGFDIYKHLIHLSLGIHDKIDLPIAQPSASLLLTSKKQGVLKEIIIPESVFNNQYLVDLFIEAKIGDLINEFKTGPDRLGHIIVIGSTAKEAEQLAFEFVSKIQFIIE
jgi:biotin carboxylase